MDRSTNGKRPVRSTSKPDPEPTTMKQKKKQDEDIEATEELVTWTEIDSLVLKETDQWMKKISIARSSRGYLSKSIKIVYKVGDKAEANRFIAIVIRPELIDSLSHLPPPNGTNIVNRGQYGYIVLPAENGVLILHSKDGKWTQASVHLTHEEIKRMRQFLLLFEAFYHEDFNFTESLWAAFEWFIPTEDPDDTDACMLTLANLLPGAPIKIRTVGDKRNINRGDAKDRLKVGMPELDETHPAVKLLFEVVAMTTEQEK